MALSTLIDKLESYIPQHQQENPNISSSTVGWQIAHALKVVRGVVRSLEISKPEEYKHKFSLSKTTVLSLQKIPRGKAKAPKYVRPEEEELSQEALQEQVASARRAVDKLQQLPKEVHFAHPYFGSLKKKQAEKFIKIHTQHHLDIIKDMLG